MAHPRTMSFEQTSGGEQQTRSRRPRMGCFLIAFAIVAIMIAIPAINLVRSKPLQITEETTFITEPLTKDGQRVDYFARIEQEFYPANFATDENGFRLLVQRVKLSSDVAPWHFNAVCKSLNLDAENLRPDLSYQEPSDFCADFVQSDEFDAAAVEALLADPEPDAESEDEADSEDEAAAPDAVADAEEEDEASLYDYGDSYGQSATMNPLLLSDRATQPWTLDDLPMMEDWLKQNSPALDLLSEAVQKPTFYIPLARQSENDALITLLLPHVQAMRSFTRGLQARANFRIGTGDIDGAIDDIVACKRFGRHLGEGVTIIHWLVGIATEGVADSIGIAGSPQHQPTKKQMERYLNAMNALPDVSSLDLKLRCERFQALDILQKLAHGDENIGNLTGETLGDAFELLMYMGFDWNIVAKQVNEHYNALDDGFHDAEFDSPLRLLLSSRAGRSETLGDLFCNSFTPAVNAVQEARRRHQCVQQIKRIVLAMLLYERDHGTLPPAYSVDEQGNMLQSWRVLLLPYLGQQDLYDKIRLDEPWDSAHNQAFHTAIVPPYHCPSAPTSKPGQTSYSVVVGSEMPFDAGSGKKLSSLGSPSGQLILLVERTVPVCWMEPDKEVPQADADAGINTARSVYGNVPAVANGISSQHPSGANCGFRDGSVRFIGSTIDDAEFKKSLRGNGAADY